LQFLGEHQRAAGEIPGLRQVAAFFGVHGRLQVGFDIAFQLLLRMTEPARGHPVKGSLGFLAIVLGIGLKLALLLLRDQGSDQGTLGGLFGRWRRHRLRRRFGVRGLPVAGAWGFRRRGRGRRFFHGRLGGGKRFGTDGLRRRQLHLGLRDRKLWRRRRGSRRDCGLGRRRRGLSRFRSTTQQTSGEQNRQAGYQGGCQKFH